MKIWGFQKSHMSHKIEIKEGAFVVSDAHYSHIRPDFLDFLKDIYSKKLKPTQLIFLGDMFDALFGGVSYTQKINQEAIKLLNDISKDIELIYLEGNHDFNLKDIFVDAKVFPISKQPLKCKYQGKTVLLAHGDFFTKDSDIAYKIYTKIIRNSFVLLILSKIDSLFGHLILKKLDKYLGKKNDCKEFIDFREYISQRLKGKYDCEYFIEGHYHQGKSMDFDDFNYINLGVFACNQRFFTVKSSQELELLEKKYFSKEK